MDHEEIVARQVEELNKEKKELQVTICHSQGICATYVKKNPFYFLEHRYLISLPERLHSYQGLEGAAVAGIAQFLAWTEDKIPLELELYLLKTFEKVY